VAGIGGSVAGTKSKIVLGSATESAGVGTGQRRRSLAFVRRERVDVDQGPDVRITGRRVGDDRAAIGVADQHDRAGERVEVGAHGRRVAGQRTQRVGNGSNGIPVVLQPFDDAA
jgi:hypothetical protein